jgi:hypothetical protein
LHGENGVAIQIPAEWKAKIPKLFPKLVEGGNFDFTSNVDWPWKHIPDDTVEGWVKVCELHGFTEADSKHFVPGYEKVAIFEDEDGVSHACRQDRSGVWKSKLGVGPDIDHTSLSDLQHGYGQIARVLQKRRPDWDDPNAPRS